MASRLGWLAVAVLSACYSPAISNGGLTCASQSSVCPQGYYCAADLHCWKTGTTPGGDDMAVADQGISGTDLQLGQPCSDDANCASGHCADGVCCGSACTDACLSCNQVGTEGTCMPLGVGAMPASGHATCGPDPAASCMRDGTCDGVGGCRLYNGTTCIDASCNSSTNTATHAGKCNGGGSCVPGGSVKCDPFKCNSQGTDCASSCSGNGDCVPPASCNNMSCGPKSNGATCTSGSECASTNCTDGYCCNATCGGTCQACDVTGSEGACSQVIGAPHGNRTACGGSGACAGTCTSASQMACTYPGSATACGQACSNGTSSAGTCNGSGTCGSITQMSCGVYACGTTACNTQCSGDTQCASGYYCSAATCIPYVTLTVTKSGSGTVTDGGGHINCGSTCSYSMYRAGDAVALTAQGTNGFAFNGWSVSGQPSACAGTGGCMFNITANTTVTATFACLAPNSVCAGMCVNLVTDPNNCGACGVVCSAGKNCVSGACQ